MVEEGMTRRFPNGISVKVREQIEHELKLIAELKYEPYFLTVFDIVRFARSKGILCQGRGSAANSAVCYCLGITEIDPARSNLAVRAVYFQGAKRAARYRRRFRASAPRRSDPIYISQIWPRIAPPSRPTVITYRTAFGDSGYRQGAGPRSRTRQTAVQARLPGGTAARISVSA